MLKFIDLFGEPLIINFKKKQKIKSTLGGILTVFLLFVVIIFSWFIGNDIFYRNNPISFTETLVKDTYDTHYFNETLFPFSVSLMDSAGNVLDDPKIVGLKIYKSVVTIIDSEAVPVHTELKLKKCENTDYPSLSKEKFEKSTIGNTMCLIDKKFNVSGFWGFEEITYFNILVTLCKNESNTICKTESEIKEFLADSMLTLNLFYLDVTVGLKNYSMPLNYYINNLYQFSEFGKFKTCEYKLQKDIIFTDANYVFNTIEETNFFKLDFMQCGSTDLDSVRKVLLNYVIYSSNKSNHYHRKYIKIPDILAGVGGLMQLFYVSFRSINMLFVDIEVYKEIIPDVFYDDSKTVVNQIKSEIILNSNHQGTSNIIISNVSLVDIKNKNKLLDDKSGIDIFLKDLAYRNKRVNLNFNFYEQLAIIFKKLCLRIYKSSLRNKIDTYEFAKNKINQYFDYSNIIQKLVEFDKLKKIVFEEEQLYVFNLKLKSAISRVNEVSNGLPIHDEMITNFLMKANGERCNNYDKNLIKLM